MYMEMLHNEFEILKRPLGSCLGGTKKYISIVVSMEIFILRAKFQLDENFVSVLAKF